MVVKVTCRTCGTSVADETGVCGTCGTQQLAPAHASGEHEASPDAAAPAPRRDLLLERLARATLGTYEIRGEIGRGGMAAVFYAHDLRMDRKVAIKVMFPDLIHRDGMVQRFDQEARMAAKLLHPNITVIHTVGEHEDLHYFVMSLVEGLSLAELLHAPTTGIPFAIPLAQSLLTQVARALHYAHGRGVVHRDVSVSNVMVDVAGDAIITDFGIAKAIESPSLTHAGATVGTPTYMSPEQCRGDAVTAASDQYSFGVLTFELLAGRPPFVGTNQTSLLLQHVQAEPPDLRALRPDVPPALADAVARMLAKRPEDRWPSLRDAIPALTTGFDEHDDAPRHALAALVAAAGPLDRTRFAPTPVTPFTRAAHARPSTPEPAHIARHELEVGATLAPPVDATLADRLLGWRTRDPDVATVAEDGTITAVAPGETVLQIVLRPDPAGGAAAPRVVCVLTVVPARVARIVLSPESVELPAGDVTALAGRVEDAAGRALAERRVYWESTNPAVATVDASGVVTGVGPGRAAIAASCEECVAEAAIVVTPPAVAALRVHADATAVRCDERVHLTAAPEDRAGRPLTDRAVTWTVEPAAAAELEASGPLSATLTTTCAGRLTVTARAEDVEAQVEISVLPRPLHALAVVPASLDVTEGDAVPLALRGTDATGAPCEAGPIRWTSTSPEIATVDDAGLVTAVAPGTATIEARSADGPTAATPTTVQAATVAGLELVPPRRPLRIGRRQRMAVTVRDARGRALVGRTLEWATRTPALVRVASDGEVTGLEPGAAEIGVTCDGVSASVMLGVVPAPRRARWLVPLGAALVAGALAVLVATGAVVAPWTARRIARQHADSVAAAATRVAIERQRADSVDAAGRQRSLDSARASDAAAQALAAQGDSADSATARAARTTRDSIAKANARVTLRITLPQRAPRPGVLWARDTVTLYLKVDTLGRQSGTVIGPQIVWGTSDSTILSFARGVARTGRPGTVTVTASLGKWHAPNRIIAVESGTPQPAVVAQPESTRARGAPTLTETEAAEAVDAFARQLERGPYKDVLALPAGALGKATEFREELLKWISDGNTTVVHRQGSPVINREEDQVRFQLLVERRKKKKFIGIVGVGDRSETRVIELRGRPEHDQSRGWSIRDVVLTSAPKQQ